MAVEPPMVGGDPSTWTPVSITMDMNGSTVVLVKGQTAIFTDLPANDATNKIVVVAKKKGKTKVTVYDGDPKSDTAIVVMQFTVQVKKATKANIEKAANALLDAAGVTPAQ